MIKASEIVRQMTLEEKAALTSGRDFWHNKAVERLGLPSVMLTDGPHGVRKQPETADQSGIGQSVPTTCFPPACCSAASFDPALLRQVGVAIGEEALQEAVAVVLGPGVNIKRSPLCGRNFEYFSEDPLLAGRLGAGLVEGIQSQGVGTSVKHFAANSQETRRMTSDSVVDERALHEIYLAAFEYIVANARPATIMASYNRLNGEYVVDSRHLLDEVLRQRWGFDGLVMSDWGAVNDRVKGLIAGLDLEMPGDSTFNTQAIRQAILDGDLLEAALDQACERIVNLVLTTHAEAREDYHYDADAHHELARRVAAESAVLLKNDDAVLPLNPSQRIALIGQFAVQPRYQGAGSSKINPTRLDNMQEAFAQAGYEVAYAQGYDLASTQVNELLIAEAEAQAREADVAVVVIGLPDRDESEGFDRQHLDLPQSHNELVEAVRAVNPRTVVVLMAGSPVLLPWRQAEDVKAILLGYLGGQAGSSALVDVLTGAVNPSGRLPESWPLDLADTPCFGNYATGGITEEYRESVFVGYRYYATAGQEVQYPFGYGLSYTTFECGEPALSGTAGSDLAVTVPVTNNGAVAGATVVQVYVAAPQSQLVFRPQRQLAGFAKVCLEPGETAEVPVVLDKRAFSYYHPINHDWAVEAGDYGIEVANSCLDVIASVTLTVEGDGQEAALAELAAQTPGYFAVASGSLTVGDTEFAAQLGRPIPQHLRQPGDQFTANSTIGDIDHTLVGRFLRKQVESAIKQAVMQTDTEADAMVQAMLNDLPLRALLTMGGGAMTPSLLNAIIAFANGHPLQGVKHLISRR